MSIETLAGKVCVVTGATSGIGLATAEALAARGARVIGVGRDPERAAKAEAMVAATARNAGPSSRSEPRFEVADFSLMREVSGLAARLFASESRIDVLVNCAGAFTSRRVLSAEGLETQFAVNYLAPFCLTTAVLPLLEKSQGGRVISVSSSSHYYGWIRWRNPSLAGRYLGLWAYEQSKLAEVLFSYELARRLGTASKISVAVADPGLVNTDMGAKHGRNLSSLFWSLHRKSGTSVLVPAEAIAFLAEAPTEVIKTGLYWRDKKTLQSSRLSYREGDARRLWEISEAALAAALGQNGAMKPFPGLS